MKNWKIPTLDNKQKYSWKCSITNILIIFTFIGHKHVLLPIKFNQEYLEQFSIKNSVSKLDRKYIGCPAVYINLIYVLFYYCREIIETMVQAYSKKIFNEEKPVFDGRKNLYSRAYLPFNRDRVNFLQFYFNLF